MRRKHGIQQAGSPQRSSHPVHAWSNQGRTAVLREPIAPLEIEDYAMGDRITQHPPLQFPRDSKWKQVGAFAEQRILKSVHVVKDARPGSYQPFAACRRRPRNPKLRSKIVGVAAVCP